MSPPNAGTVTRITQARVLKEIEKLRKNELHEVNERLSKLERGMGLLIEHFGLDSDAADQDWGEPITRDFGGLS